MKKIFVITVLLLSGCADIANNPKATGGTLLGGIGGGLAGAQFGKGKGQLAATALGALGGAFLGNSIGSSLDKVDHMYANNNANQALNSSQPMRWSNSNTGNSGTFIPYQSYGMNGKECKNYESTTTIGNNTEHVRGTVCRDSVGSSWYTVN